MRYEMILIAKIAISPYIFKQKEDLVNFLFGNSLKGRL
jgi:hypothetical protein